MKLKKFIKNRNQKQIVIGSIVGITLLIGGITLYRTFAMYKVEQSFDVLKGTVPDFSSGDVTLAFTINSVKTNGVSFPNMDEGFTKKSVTCEKGVEADWDDTTWSLKVKNSNDQSRIKCTIDFNAPTFSAYLKSKIIDVLDGESGLIVQTHEATDQTGTYATTDYRYIGANPNNYVCLEENGECTEENLYRIIGVIPTQKDEIGEYEDRVKLIKNTNYVGQTALDCTAEKYGKGYYWSGSESNTSNDWTQSTLNKDVLNKEYWESIQNYQKYIENAKWYLGEDSVTNDNVFINKLYKAERSGSTSLANIGLFYASDYGFATSGSEGEMSRNNCLAISANSGWYMNSIMTDCANNNWLRNSTIEPWTLTATDNGNMDGYKRAYAIAVTGNIYYGSSAVNKKILNLLPSFYLKSNVLFQNGNGTHGNPYRISISEN